MNLTLNLKDFGNLARTVGLTLIVFAAIFIAACDDTPQPAPAPQAAATPQAAAAPQAAATPSGAPAAAQPPRTTPTEAPAPSPGATPVATAPSSAAASVPAGPKLNIVTTTNFVADWGRVVGGDRVDVVSLLPPGAGLAGTERAALEVWAFCLVWLATFAHAWARPGRAWREQCWTIALLAALAPLLNWMTTGDHLLRALAARHLWPVAGMDLLLLAGAAVAVLAARKPAG